MKNIPIAILLLYSFTIKAQYSFKAYLKDRKEKNPLAQSTANLKGTNKSVTADSTGFVILKNVPVGKQVLIFSHVGQKEKTFTFPLSSVAPVEIFLEEAGEEMGEVIVTSTRTS